MEAAALIIPSFMAGLLTFLAPYRLWLGRIGGVFVILFGLFMLNVIKIPWLSGEKRLAVPDIFARDQ